MSAAAVLTALHTVAAGAWVGGIFFAYLALRPAAAELAAPQRLALWVGVTRRFFPWVWACVAVLLLTGYGLLGLGVAGAHIHLMQATGWLMMLLFGQLYVRPYRSLCAAAAAGDWAAAGAALARIRPVMAANLVLGLVTLAVGASGRYW